jgi:hypothetical protein
MSSYHTPKSRPDDTSSSLKRQTTYHKQTTKFIINDSNISTNLSGGKTIPAERKTVCGTETTKSWTDNLRKNKRDKSNLLSYQIIHIY